MVVTRRTSSTVPMPPTSRTNSAQTTPKVNKGKSPQSSSLAHAVETALVNGDESTASASLEPDYSEPQYSDDAVFMDGLPSPKKSPTKGTSKSKKKARHKKRNALDSIAQVFLLFFLIYSLSVCPNDKKLQSPVCRGLSEYKRLVLEPYVFQPIHNALQHPSVAPYVEGAKPHIQTVVRFSAPVVTRVQQQWKARIVPQWQKYVTPQWEAHVSPHIRRVEYFLEPYRRNVSNFYRRSVTPYVVQTQLYLRKARPYFLYTAARVYDSYQSSKPYFARVTKELQHFTPLVSKYILHPLGSARRQFVDQHVARIWEKVKELSTGKPSVESDSSEGDVLTPPPANTPTILQHGEGVEAEIELPPVPEPTDEPAQSAASIISSSAYLGDALTVSVPGATYSPSPSIVPEEPIEEIITSSETAENEAKEILLTVSTLSSDISEQTSTADVLVSLSTTPATSSTVSSIVNVPSEGVSLEDSPLDVQVPEVTEVTSTIEVSEAHEVPVVTSSITSSSPSASSVSVIPSPSPLSSGDDPQVDFDLDEFYAELGLEPEVSEKTEPSPEVQAPPKPREKTEEEKAEEARLKAIETAEKRRDIEARHTKWEQRLQKTIARQNEALRAALTALRKVAVADLKASEVIRSEIDKLHLESEKALRGTEAYFAKLRKENKSREEKVKLWDRVLQKVEAKFEERVHNVEVTVNGWYFQTVQQEMNEIDKAATIVKNLAEEGQADIGMDYAWLDDVTYMDWQRYHALLGEHKNFLQEAWAIQNGTHESAPPNAVLSALEDLQSEVEDITVGFETRLRRIKREGARAFSSDESSETLDVEEEDTSERLDKPEVPEVSILPIPKDPEDGQSNTDDEVLQNVAEAILGRSEEEVLSALERAEGGSREETITHEEL